MIKLDLNSDDILEMDPVLWGSWTGIREKMESEDIEVEEVKIVDWTNSSQNSIGDFKLSIDFYMYDSLVFWTSKECVKALVGDKVFDNIKTQLRIIRS